MEQLIVKPKRFLTAEWRNLIMANYLVDAAVLKPFVPAKTELDTWNDNLYVSLVGFMFDETRVMRMRVPYHVRFPEVNLRFYVRYKDGNGYKRGVVFIKEIVPKPAITFVANRLFNERYVTLPMKTVNKKDLNKQHIGYHWKFNNIWNKLEVITPLEKLALQEGSEQEFITEHFWGYSSNGKKTNEYHVQHPRWHIYPIERYHVNCNFGALYGEPFSALDKQKPYSVFLAAGSPVTVFKKRTL
jgi:uncharacterized protein